MTALKTSVAEMANAEARRRATRLGVTFLVDVKSGGAPVGVKAFLERLGLVGGGISKEQLEIKARDVFRSASFRGRTDEGDRGHSV